MHVWFIFVFVIVRGYGFEHLLKTRWQKNSRKAVNYFPSYDNQIDLDK
jgi:hypothetical protein